jgi:hypothetical protein
MSGEGGRRAEEQRNSWWCSSCGASCALVKQRERREMKMIVTLFRDGAGGTSAG